MIPAVQLGKVVGKGAATGKICISVWGHGGEGCGINLLHVEFRCPWCLMWGCPLTDS